MYSGVICSWCFFLRMVKKLKRKKKESLCITFFFYYFFANYTQHALEYCITTLNSDKSSKICDEIRKSLDVVRIKFGYNEN
jgi:hypothetical protein